MFKPVSIFFLLSLQWVERKSSKWVMQRQRGGGMKSIRTDNIWWQSTVSLVCKWFSDAKGQIWNDRGLEVDEARFRKKAERYWKSKRDKEREREREGGSKNKGNKNPLKNKQKSIAWKTQWFVRFCECFSASRARTYMCGCVRVLCRCALIYVPSLPYSPLYKVYWKWRCFSSRSRPIAISPFN